MKFYKIALIGFLAGVISGLFTSGGGLILVPAFIYLLKIEDKKARGTAIVCILPMVMTSSFFYYKQNNIDISLVAKCAIGGVIGGVIGAKLLNKIPSIYIKALYAFFLLYVSIKILFFAK